jgi:hypothetical protein
MIMMMTMIIIIIIIKQEINMSLYTPQGHIGNSWYRSPHVRTGTGCKRVVSFTSRPPHSRGKSPNMNA